MVKTASDKWNTDIKKLRKKCQDIAVLSKKIRYVGVINIHGRTLAGVMRPATKPLLDHENTRNEFFLTSALVNMRHKYVRYTGELNHITINHDDVHVILLHKNTNTYYISLDANVRNMSGIIPKIKRVVMRG